ncbi:MAG: amidohydrolase [Betaproteobacteria bacterium]|nr:amidohydrolase [Betaproteobacteria bacterium]
MSNDVCATPGCIDPACLTAAPQVSAEPYFGRRDFLKQALGAGAGLMSLSVLGGCATTSVGSGPVDTVIINAKISVMDKRNRRVSAIAIRGETIAAIGSDAEMMALKGADTKVIDAGGRTIVPGLNDAHTHFIRGGLTYSMEVRWDGVPSLADAMRMLQTQAARTPAPHWVQVIGGFSAAQFAEKRLPTLAEINAATGDTPAMIMHMYDRTQINRAGLRVLGWTRDTPNPFGGVIEKDGNGNPTGLLTATIGLPALVNTWLKVPRLSPADQMLSTRLFMREHNRLGITSVIDAGGGGQNYPDNYAAIAQLAKEKQMTVRIGYELFAQAGGRELENYQAWSKMVKQGEGDDYFRMLGAGEYIVWALGDVTSFGKDPQVIPPVMESQLTAVGKYLAGERWPFRMHTSFDATAVRALGVLEKVNQEVPLKGLRWGFDHCETLQPKTLERIAALGGSINIQNRMSLDGEAFNARYGAQVSADAPPIARIREMGIPLAAGTDANRATSYNPWIGVHWLITGKTLGGAKLQGDRNLLDRTEALRLYTAGGAWMSNEENKKGTLEPGRLADLIVLSDDYFNMPVENIRNLESMLTMVGGKVVYGAGSYERLAPPAPVPAQDWLPVKEYGRYFKTAGLPATNVVASGHAHPVIIGDAGPWTMECPCAF